MLFLDLFSMISIHASAREATEAKDTKLLTVDLFQSTPPRGRRPRDTLKESADNCNFNPRLREGGDFPRWLLSDLFVISIHASAREAT